MMQSEHDVILSVKHLSKTFSSRMDFVENIVHKLGGVNKNYTLVAVQDVSFEIQRGQIFGLVGESGCGKSTIGKMLSGMYKPSAGEYAFNGVPYHQLLCDKERIKIQIIMQDSFGALNNRKKVIDILTEAPLHHHIITRAQRRNFAKQLMNKIGLSADDLYKFPHMFSGGQQQRINIARALAVQPELLICDESVSALDVSIQAQILNLLLKLQKEYKLSMLFISHNLGVIKHIANVIAVMYLGKIVEYGATEAIFQTPQHPYTQVLLAAVPNLNEFRRAFKPISGEVPSPLDPPEGCPFHPRCTKKQPLCSETAPVLQGSERKVSCHLVDM